MGDGQQLGSIPVGRPEVSLVSGQLRQAHDSRSAPMCQVAVGVPDAEDAELSKRVLVVVSSV